MGRGALCPPAALGGTPQKAPLSQAGWHRPPFKASPEEVPSLPLYISWGYPTTPVSSGVCSSGGDPPKDAQLKGCLEGFPQAPAKKPRGSHGLRVRKRAGSWGAGERGGGGHV